MIFRFSKDQSKEEIFSSLKEQLQAAGFRILKTDSERPWGGFFVIDETQAKAFIQQFFPGLEQKISEPAVKRSPKILVVAPEKRLSWQYHFRRNEIWCLVGGKAALSRSTNDQENIAEELVTGKIVKLAVKERHRLIGLESWGIVAEIWQHEDPGQPSNEDDIVRLQDDYGR